MGNKYTIGEQVRLLKEPSCDKRQAAFLLKAAVTLLVESLLFSDSENSVRVAQECLEYMDEAVDALTGVAADPAELSALHSYRVAMWKRARGQKWAAVSDTFYAVEAAAKKPFHIWQFVNIAKHQCLEMLRVSEQGK